MATLILMCGMAFSGKTTLARTLVERLGCAYVSLDDINADRGLWGGEGIPVEEWERTHQLALGQLRERLVENRCVVLDDTNSLRWLRDRFRDAAAEGGHNVRLVYMDTPLKEIDRRMKRSRDATDRRRVRDDVFAQLLASFQVPGPDEDPVVVGIHDDAEAVVAWLG